MFTEPLANNFDGSLGKKGLVGIVAKHDPWLRGRKFAGPRDLLLTTPESLESTLVNPNGRESGRADVLAAGVFHGKRSRVVVGSSPARSG